MIIYDKKPRYSPDTGEQVGHQFVEKERRCDVSGKLLYDGEQGSEPIVSYSFDYQSTDAGYGTVDGEYELRMEHHVVDHQFMDSPFEIRWDVEDGLRELFMLSEEDRFDRFLRKCRAQAAIRLLEEGVIEAWQLDGGPDPE